MKLALLSDIHGNLPALRAALEVAAQAGADRIVVAGDLVGEGPYPCEVIQELRWRGIEAIRGNVDRKVLRLCGRKRKRLEKWLERESKGGHRLNRAWTALQLKAAPAEREWLEALPPEMSLTVGDREVMVVHGSPLGDTDYLYPSLTPEALTNKLHPLEGKRPDILVAGHSHLPFAREIAGVWVVNCGSVGRPKDGDPRGALAMVEIESEGSIHAQIHRFTYAVMETTAALDARAVPGIDPQDYIRGVKS